MNPEKQPLDLSSLAKNRSLEVVYSFDEADEFEPTVNLIPLTIAVEVGLAKIVQAKDAKFYVVTPATIDTSEQKEVPVEVVSADVNEYLDEKQVTTYTFTTCGACGGLVVDEGRKEISEENTPCDYCGTMNKGTAQTKKVEIRKFEVGTIWDETESVGTVEELTKKTKAAQANQSSRLYRLKQFFSLDRPVPLEVIETAKDFVDPERKIRMSGPFLNSEDNHDIFIQIGELRAIGRKPEEKAHTTVNRGELYPRIPGSYLVETVEDITDHGDYLLIIESDTGERLPFVVMNDRDGKPSRFVVPVDELFAKGWRIFMGGFDRELNGIINWNSLNQIAGHTKNEIYGTVKSFHWNNDSQRHDAITDALSDNDFNDASLYVSADILNGDVSSLKIEQSG